MSEFDAESSERRERVDDGSTAVAGVKIALVGTVLILLFVLASAIVAPLLIAVLLTVVHLVVNEILGVRRWTAVLAYPAVFVFVPLIVYALARRTFVWGGRRYHWRGKFDVSVVG